MENGWCTSTLVDHLLKKLGTRSKLQIERIQRSSRFVIQHARLSSCGWQLIGQTILAPGDEQSLIAISEAEVRRAIFDLDRSPESARHYYMDYDDDPLLPSRIPLCKQPPRFAVVPVSTMIHLPPSSDDVAVWKLLQSDGSRISALERAYEANGGQRKYW